MTWNERIEKMKREIDAAQKLFISPRRRGEDYSAALALVGVGKATFDGCYFKTKGIPQND